MARAKKPSTPGDMVRSLALILLPVLVISVLFTRNIGDAPVTVVEWQPVLAKARAEAPYPVLAPSNLPEQWRPTRVNWVKAGEPFLNGAPAVRNTWQLGFLAPDDIYIALSQGDLEPADFVKDATREGRPDGESQVDGQQWERRVTDDDRTRALVLTTPEVTSIVAGDTSYEALESYTATLRTT